jgi:hypothetical protein
VAGDIEPTRLVMLMEYVEKHQHPPDRGVTHGQLIHAGYTKEEIDAAVSEGYIERMPGIRMQYAVSGYPHGSL